MSSRWPGFNVSAPPRRARHRNIVRATMSCVNFRRGRRRQSNDAAPGTVSSCRRLYPLGPAPNWVAERVIESRTSEPVARTGIHGARPLRPRRPPISTRVASRPSADSIDGSPFRPWNATGWPQTPITAADLVNDRVADLRRRLDRNLDDQGVDRLPRPQARDGGVDGRAHRPCPRSSCRPSSEVLWTLAAVGKRP